MNSRFFFLAPFTFFLAPLLDAQSTAEPPAPPPVAQALPRPASPMPQPGQQRVYGPSSDTLIARETADGILQGFRKAYNKTDHAPRVVIYVNRALVDSSGWKMTRHTEHYEKVDVSLKTSGDNTYTSKDAAVATVADQQTVREIERLF